MGRIERQFDAFRAAGERGGNRPGLRREPLHFCGERFAVLHGEALGTAREGVLVRAAADRDQRDGAGEVALDRLLRTARPIAMNEIPLQRRAMARVARKNRADAPRLICDEQRRQIVIDRPVGGARPAIRREVDLAHRPAKMRGLAIGKCRQRHLLDLVGQLSCVALGQRQMFGRDIHAEEVRQHSGQHRRAMSVA